MSSPDDEPALVAALQTNGDAVRSVIRYDEADHEIVFIRDDVDLTFEPADLDTVVDDLLLRGWGQSYLDDVFTAGNLRCSAFAFEDAKVLLFGQNDCEGVLVTYDRGTGVDLDTFIDICETHP